MTDFVYSLLIERMRTRIRRTTRSQDRRRLEQAINKLEYRRNIDRSKT